MLPEIKNARTWDISNNDQRTRSLVRLDLAKKVDWWDCSKQLLLDRKGISTSDKRKSCFENLSPRYTRFELSTTVYWSKTTWLFQNVLVRFPRSNLYIILTFIMIRILPFSRDINYYYMLTCELLKKPAIVI